MTIGVILIWVLTIVTAGMFLVAGTAKLRGHPMLIQVFDKVGLGQWFRIFTGVIEIGSALALLYPPTAAFGALLLACTMAVALIVDVLVVHINPTPGILLFLSSSFLLWYHRETIFHLLASLGILAG